MRCCLQADTVFLYDDKDMLLQAGPCFYTPTVSTSSGTLADQKKENSI